MAFRNGIVADALRKAGMPYGVIFGLQLPQISDIAKQAVAGLDDEERLTLANVLWEDRNVRESRLLACYLYPKSLATKENILRMAEDVRTREEADILAFRLVSKLPVAEEILEEVDAKNDKNCKYFAKALARNLENM